jgi:hypothetical protein
MRKIVVILAALFVSLVCAQGAYASYSIDGNLADWGVTPGAYGASDWTPDPGVYYTVEDFDPSDPSGFVDPGTGGQTFDAEAMYISYDNDNLYYAIVTGLPATGADNGEGGIIRPGDIAFDFGNDGSYEYGIGGSDYWRNPGSLYTVSLWEPGPDWPGKGTVAAPTEMITYSELFHGDASNFAYNNTFYGNFDHWVIEGFVPLSYFGVDWGQPFTAHWTQTCGNDAINVPVPEPATLSLLGIGMVCLLRLKKII